jgi:peptide/nickel transport system permease protein
MSILVNEKSYSGSRKELVEAKQSLNKERRKLIFNRFLSNRSALIGSIIVIICAFIAIFAPLIAPYDPLQMKIVDRIQAPSAAHLFGTDDFGRDIFSRVIYGSQISMGAGISVVIITSVLGLIFGLYSAYYRSIDNVLMRINDGLMAFPEILLAIALMAVLGPNIFNVIIALSIVYTPSVARAVRSAALTVREQTYIDAMRALGASSWRIIWLHMAPNCFSPLIIQATFIFAYSIIIEAALSFLGAGTPPPAPSWGNILNDGKVILSEAWWMTVFPGFTIIITVLGLNLLGDGLRDLLDPHTNKSK